jgi:hypothetical protein
MQNRTRAPKTQTTFSQRLAFPPLCENNIIQVTNTKYRIDLNFRPLDDGNYAIKLVQLRKKEVGFPVCINTSQKRVWDLRIYIPNLFNNLNAR